MKFWFPITVFFNVYVIFLKFIFLASASGCCQVIVTWRNYQARYQPDILNPVNFFFFFFGEACQRLFTKLTDQCLDAPYLILQWNARKIKQWASAFCRICQGNLDHALGVQRRDRRQERIHWPRQTFSLTEASLFGSDVHSEDTWHIEKWAQERQRGIQSVLGTTVAFFTPRTSRVKGQGRQNLDGRGNVLTVATSLKLLRPQDVWLPEVITVRAVQGLHRDGGWLAKIHECDHCLGVRVAQHPAPVPGWSVIAQVVPGQTVGPVRHGQVMQAGLLLLRLGQGAEQGPHVPVQMMCVAQKKGVWGAVLVTSSPTSRPMLGWWPASPGLRNIPSGAAPRRTLSFPWELQRSLSWVSVSQGSPEALAVSCGQAVVLQTFEQGASLKSAVPGAVQSHQGPSWETCCWNSRTVFVCGSASHSVPGSQVPLCVQSPDLQMRSICSHSGLSGHGEDWGPLEITEFPPQNIYMYLYILFHILFHCGLL